MVELDLGSILQTVEAQSGDANVQPTFITDIDFSDGTSDDAGGDTGDDTGDNTDDDNQDQTSDTVGSINLASTSTTFSVGSEFEVEVRVNSGATAISSYSIKIEFDSDYVQVIDMDLEESGVQIAYLHEDFSLLENTANNSTGSIIIRAQTSSPEEVNKAIANITFRAVAEGQTQIEVKAQESSLVNDTSTNILEESSSLSVSLGDEAVSVVETIEDPVLPDGEISSLPKSDLPFTGIVFIILGLIFIYVGFSLKRKFER
jgi:hypothetical protein